MYKVYCYTNRITNKKYIGLTSTTPDERAGSNGINYHECTSFYVDILKYGFDSFDREILVDNIKTLNEANEIEAKYISELKTQNPENGYNIQPGGSSFIMNDSIKKIIGERVKASKKFKVNNKLAHSRKVIAINIKTKSVMEFESITDAATKLNVARASISKCCTHKDNSYSLNGILWVYADEYISDRDYIKEYNEHRKNITYGKERNLKISQSIIKNTNEHTRDYLRKKVIRIDKITGSEVEYNSIKDAASDINLKAPGNITLVCNGKRSSAGGFKWKWKK